MMRPSVAAIRETVLRRFDSQRADLERALRDFLSAQGAELLRAAQLSANALAAGGKLLFFGNGGSAAEAQHLAAELVNRMTRDRRALSALALSTDTSSLTSIANDSSYDRVFARQIEAVGRAGDIVVPLSTSGNSPSILLGMESARAAGISCVAFLGRDGGRARALADISLVVGSSVTARIQEVHLFAGHLFCEMIEEILVPV